MKFLLTLPSLILLSIFFYQCKSNTSNIPNALSKEFGEAQFLATYRVVSFVCWMKSIDGNTIRVYDYADGENISIAGEPTPIEKKLKLVNTLSLDAKDPKIR